MPWGAAADWTFLWQRGFTKQLTGQRYRGIVNGYDMICLASFLIKACWGNVSASTRCLTGQSSVNGGHCLSPSFLQRSKFHCDYTKASGHWPGLLDMLWWGDIEAKQSSTNNQPTSGCSRKLVPSIQINQNRAFRNLRLHALQKNDGFFLPSCQHGISVLIPWLKSLWRVDTRRVRVVVLDLSPAVAIIVSVKGADLWKSSRHYLAGQTSRERMKARLQRRNEFWSRQAPPTLTHGD